MKTLKEWLGLCVHQWNFVERINVYVTWYGERYEGQRPGYFYYVLQCEKCGKIKKKKV